MKSPGRCRSRPGASLDYEHPRGAPPPIQAVGRKRVNDQLGNSSHEKPRPLAAGAKLPQLVSSCDPGGVGGRGMGMPPGLGSTSIPTLCLTSDM